MSLRIVFSQSLHHECPVFMKLGIELFLHVHNGGNCNIWITRSAILLNLRFSKCKCVSLMKVWLSHRFRWEMQESAPFSFWHEAPIGGIRVFPTIKRCVRHLHPLRSEHEDKHM